MNYVRSKWLLSMTTKAPLYLWGQKVFFHLHRKTRAREEIRARAPTPIDFSLFSLSLLSPHFAFPQVFSFSLSLCSPFLSFSLSFFSPRGDVASGRSELGGLSLIRITFTTMWIQCCCWDRVLIEKKVRNAVMEWGEIKDNFSDNKNEGQKTWTTKSFR